MKFGEYLHAQKLPEWENYYLNYDRLKQMIEELEELNLIALSTTSKVTSLTIPPPTNAAGVPIESGKAKTQEEFFRFLEQEMLKIETFTQTQVQKIRQVLHEVERKITLSEITENEALTLQRSLEYAGEDFLKLEKFVNLNFMGFHKILKKHDKKLPNPCKSFYIARLQGQSWLRADYSDIMVSMSRVYSKLRGDKVKVADETAKQDFVRSTRKYWVYTENISSVKYTVLQHLPVFLQKSMEGGETDSQLVNSVYLDNFAMELYKGRLEKSPGAIALRFRWYGNEKPDVIYVERKTHRDSWTGEVSVKERFTIKEDQVLPLLQGKFDLEGEINKLRSRGKSESDIKEYQKLASEVIQVINSKQLVPCMRTQYMRTAFQIPFDATVRISLDTNLIMITERVAETLEGSRWYRNPQQPVPANEITRFPHGVLEIKLQLEDEESTPDWVRLLLDSGKLSEIHKFSKFIHGCAVLLHDDVPAVPYWIDDPSLVDSIRESQSAGKLFLEGNPAISDSKKAKPNGANKYYSHLLPNFGRSTEPKIHPSIVSKSPPETPTSPSMQSISKSKKNVAPSLKEPLLLAEAATTTVQPMGMTDNPGDENIINTNSMIFSSSLATTTNEKVVVPPKHGWTCCWSKEERDNLLHRQNNNNEDEEEENCITFLCGDWAMEAKVSHITFQKVEPKVFFANERTYLSWLQMSVLLSSVSITVLAFTNANSDVGYFAMSMLPIAFAITIYAVKVYLARGTKIGTRDPGRWDEPMGPVVLSTALIGTLFVLFLVFTIKFAINVSR